MSEKILPEISYTSISDSRCNSSYFVEWGGFELSINYQKLKSMVDHYQIFDLVAYITEEVQSLQSKSLAGIVKEWLTNLQTEEELYELIRFCDEALLNRLSRMLTTYGYRRFGSIRMVTLYCDDLLRRRQDTRR